MSYSLSENDETVGTVRNYKDFLSPNWTVIGRNSVPKTVSDSFTPKIPLNPTACIAMIRKAIELSHITLKLYLRVSVDTGQDEAN